VNRDTVTKLAAGVAAALSDAMIEHGKDTGGRQAMPGSVKYLVEIVRPAAFKVVTSVAYQITWFIHAAGHRGGMNVPEESLRSEVLGLFMKAVPAGIEAALHDRREGRTAGRGWWPQ